MLRPGTSYFIDIMNFELWSTGTQTRVTKSENKEFISAESFKAYHNITSSVRPDKARGNKGSQNMPGIADDKSESKSTSVDFAPRSCMNIYSMNYELRKSNT